MIGADARRAARQDLVLARLHRLQPEHVPAAHPGDPGPAPAHLHLRRGARVGRPQPALYGRRRSSWALGVLVIIDRTGSARKKNGQLAGDDPWGGETLEWATTSPPPHYNFVTVPTVRSKEPMWDQPELHGGRRPPEDGRLRARRAATRHVVDEPARRAAASGRPHAARRRRGPSISRVRCWPCSTGSSLESLLRDLDRRRRSSCIVTLMGWFWPRGETQETR